jgi:hypothetical protein
MSVKSFITLAPEIKVIKLLPSDRTYKLELLSLLILLSQV